MDKDTTTPGAEERTNGNKRKRRAISRTNKGKAKQPKKVVAKKKEKVDDVLKNIKRKTLDQADGAFWSKTVCIARF